MAAKRTLFKIEFLFRTSTTIVYQFLTTPACLVRWFCDEVDIDNNKFTFTWNGYAEIANLIEDWEDELLRFEWEDADPTEYLEFLITKSPITEETVLTITDFSEPGGVQKAKQLWESQIRQMRTAMGI
jgi:uncharacterized protein YndB with AHSA1/START domain